MYLGLFWQLQYLIEQALSFSIVASPFWKAAAHLWASPCVELCSGFAAAAASTHGDCLVAALCSNASPAAYNYRSCAAARKAFLTLRLSGEHKPTLSWWKIRKTCHTLRLCKSWEACAGGARGAGDASYLSAAKLFLFSFSFLYLSVWKKLFISSCPLTHSVCHLSTSNCNFYRAVCLCLHVSFFLLA